ncbi:MAG TPA: PIN domain-containing protein [Vicinamibacterales bacterium]
MIVVDTSVWVAARRTPGGAVSNALSSLLDADEVALPLPVRLELWAGTARADRKRFQRAFSALPLLVPTDETWRPLEDWIARAADRGHRFAITDLLIARLADEAGALVWSLDKDFERLAALRLVRLYSA